MYHNACFILYGHNFISSFFSVQLPPHFTCQLCSELYKEPRILPCLHSFCGQCLYKEIEGSGTKHSIECPTCQNSTTIPEGGVSAIPQNLHLGFEAEVAGYISKISSDGEKLCDSCIDGGMGPAVAFCCTCHHLLCKLCHDYHEHNKIFCHHQIVGLDKESLKLLPSMIKPVEKYYCSHPNHKKDELRLYCETCQLLTCKECLHQDHRIAEMCNIAKAHRDGMKKALECCQEATLKLTRAIETYDKMAEDGETSKDNATLIINQAFEQIHQTIEERRKTLLAEVEAISLSITTALTLKKERLMKIQDEIAHYTKITSQILQTHTDNEIVALGDLLPIELVNIILKKVENVFFAPKVFTDIHVSVCTDYLIKELSKFGHVMDSPSLSQSTWSSDLVARAKEMYAIKVETMTSKRERYLYGGMQVKAELRPMSEDEAVVPGEVEDHGDGTYTITITPETIGHHQLLITMDGEHVQNSPCDLDVRKTYSTLCDAKKIINCNGDPHGIAIDDSGIIYVTIWVGRCGDIIRVFNEAGKVIGTIGRGGYGDGEFSYPQGLCIKGGEIYVADQGNNRIQKFTTKGKFLKQFGHYGSASGEFIQPVSVIVDQSNRLIVADRGNNRIQILDEAGTWLLTIGGNITGCEFTSPYGVALDPEGNIHITSTYVYNCSNTIKVFTPEGKYVKSYGDEKDQNRMHMVIDEEGCSLVTEKNCLSIFSPHGCKVHTIEHLNNPLDVTLDPMSGNVYVVINGSYQIFKFCV